MACTIMKITSNTFHGSGKPPPRDFNRLEKYIKDASCYGDKLYTINGKEIYGSLNCESANWQDQCKEIKDKIKKFKGRGEPVAHYVISYEKGKGETLSEADMKKDVQKLLCHLGYHDHQVLYAVHGNTDNIHIHVVVNKINSNNQIPSDVGTVVLKDKKRMKRHDALCQHAAMFDICSNRNWNTDHCLVNDLGQKIKQQKSGKISKGELAKEQRTGKKSEQRNLLELLQKEIPMSKPEVANFFEKHGITYEIKTNKLGKDNGLVYKYNGIKTKSSLMPDKWQFKNISPILNQTSQHDAKFLSKNRKDFLFKAFKHAKQNDTNYLNLENYLNEYGYKLDKGRVHHAQGSCKFSEIWREFSSTKMEQAFSDNLSKISQAEAIPIVKIYENYDLNDATRQIANKMFASAKNKDAQLALLDLDIILEKAKIDHSFSQSELKYLEKQYEKTRAYIKSKDSSFFKSDYELANERITQQRLFEYKKEILDEYRNIAVNDIANISSLYNITWNKNNLNLGVSHEKM